MILQEQQLGVTDNMRNSAKLHDGAPAELITDGAPTALQLKLLDIRAERNWRIKLCDWTVGTDSGLSDSKKAKWVTYRQTLRDFPATITDIGQAVIWPDEPENINSLENKDHPAPRAGESQDEDGNYF